MIRELRIRRRHMEEKWFLLFRGGWLGAWISRRWVNKQKGEVKDMIFICQIAIAKTSFMSKHHLPQTNIPTIPTNFPLIKTKIKRELNPYSIFLLAHQLPFPLWSNSSFPTFACVPLASVLKFTTNLQDWAAVWLYSTQILKPWGMMEFWDLPH